MTTHDRVPGSPRAELVAGIREREPRTSLVASPEAVEALHRASPSARRFTERRFPRLDRSPDGRLLDGRLPGEGLTGGGGVEFTREERVGATYEIVGGAASG